MKVFIALTLLFAAALALTEQEYQSEFVLWMHKYGKSFDHEDFRFRYSIFKKNLDYINDYNSQNRSAKLAMNAFGALSNEEYQKYYLGFRMPASGVLEGEVATFDNVALPDSWDWTQKGAVTPVKNQGQCGSCWSFSTTGSVEGCHFLGTGNLVSLSEQNLVDCSTAQGNMGCNGGLMTQAMNYIISNGGIDTESSYPYTAQDGTCQYNAANKGSTQTSYKNVQSGSESDLQQAVYNGPTSVAIDASQSSFQFYSSGVYDEPNCSSTQLDHGVLAAGWGVDSSSGKAYWLVKNSWGTSWGQNGYIWMSRNANNQCGIATMATLPSGCN